MKSLLICTGQVNEQAIEHTFERYISMCERKQKPCFFAGETVMI